MSLFKEIVYVFIEMAPFLMFGFLFAGILHVFIKKDLIVKHLGKSSGGAVIKASLFGVPLPLCSCSVIPTAISLKKSGASNASVLSFLLSTPLTGVDSIVATYGFLGPVFGLFRPIAAFFIGILGGTSALFINTETSVDNNTPQKQSCCCSSKGKNESLSNNTYLSIIIYKVKSIIKYAFKTLLDDITIPLIIGLLVSGIISWIIPDNFFADLNISNFTQMLIMIIVGIPIYVCATSSLPIGAALLLKGLSPGVIFVFLVAGPATNSATVALIVKQFGKKFFALYFSTISLLSICFGLLLDKIINIYGLKIDIGLGFHGEHGASLFYQVIAVIFFTLIIASLVRKIRKKPQCKA